MIEIHERSNYLKGLMLLLKRDRVIEEPEKELMKGVGKILGFEKEFVQSSIEDLLENERRRRKHNRLGFVYQLAFVRVYNRFPIQRPNFEINHELLTFVGVQLD